MRRQFSEVRKAIIDPDVAKQVRAEMDTYADRTRTLDQEIVKDLSTCPHDQDVLNVVFAMPEL
jgi:hypothetical protein